MASRSKARMLAILDDEDFIEKLKRKLSEDSTPNVLNTKKVSKQIIQDLFEVHFKEHINYKIKWEEVNKNLIEEMVGKVILLSKEDGIEVSRTEVVKKIREGYHSRKRTYHVNKDKKTRRATRVKNRRSYLTYQKRNVAVRHAVEEGVLDPTNKVACQEFRKIISPHKGSIPVEVSSDEELQNAKKQTRKEVLAKARTVKERNEELKKQFLFAKSREYNDFLANKDQNEEEEDEEEREDDSDNTCSSDDAIPSSQTNNVRRSLFLTS